MASEAVHAAADPIHEETCKDNSHDGPEAEWPCVALASRALAAARRSDRG